MISVIQLFYRRMISEWKFQYNVWRTSIDWTVGLYLVVPSIAIGLDYYVQLWKNQPAWMEAVPFSGLLLIVYLFAWSGTIRLFLEEGDQLFLLQYRNWIRKMIMFGIGYSAVLALLLSLLVFFLLAPFWFMHYKLSMLQFALLFVFIILFKMNIGLARQLFMLRFSGWKQWVAYKSAFILTSVVFTKGTLFAMDKPGLFFTCCILLLVTLGFLIKMRLNLKGSFYEDIAREQRERLKYVSLLLSLSGVSPPKPVSQKRCPLLFRSSNPLFRERSTVNVLVELCIKAVLRDKNKVYSYIQLVAVCILLILSFPVFWKWLIWLVLAFLLTIFANSYYKKVVSSSFVQLFRWKAEDKSEAARGSMFLLMLPGFLLVGLVFGFQTFSWIGACVALPAGITLGYYVAKFISSFG